MSFGQLDVGFWTDPEVRALTEPQRMILLFFIANRLRSFIGLYQLPLAVVAHGVQHTEAEVRAAVDGPLRRWLTYDHDTMEVWVHATAKRALQGRRFSEMQRKGAVRLVGLCESRALRAAFIRRYGELFGITPTDFDTPIQTPLETPPDRSRDTPLETPLETPSVLGEGGMGNGEVGSGNGELGKKQQQQQKPRAKRAQGTPKKKTRSQVAISAGGNGTRPPRATWLTPYWEDWIAAYGGAPVGGQLAKALGPVHERHGEATLRPAWRRYLLDTEAKFASPSRFASTVGTYLGTAPKTGTREMRNAMTAAEWAARDHLPGAF